MEDFGFVSFRESTRAYIINDGKKCIPHPDDASIPASVQEEFAGIWESVDEYVKANPEKLVSEKPLEMSPEQNTLMSAMEEEAKRVPDLEDATVELADYVVSLEERIAELEARLEANNG